MNLVICFARLQCVIKLEGELKTSTEWCASKVSVHSANSQRMQVGIRGNRLLCAVACGRGGRCCSYLSKLFRSV